SAQGAEHGPAAADRGLQCRFRSRPRSLCRSLPRLRAVGRSGSEHLSGAGRGDGRTRLCGCAVWQRGRLMARRPLCAALTRMPAGNPVDYAWNEWEVQSYFNWADNAELARLSLLTGRANIALAIAICEWIEARFVPH